MIERTNLRHLSGLPQKVDLVTLDLSFISILLVSIIKHFQTALLPCLHYFLLLFSVSLFVRFCSVSLDLWIPRFIKRRLSLKQCSALKHLYTAHAICYFSWLLLNVKEREETELLLVIIYNQVVLLKAIPCWTTFMLNFVNIFSYLFTFLNRSCPL